MITVIPVIILLGGTEVSALLNRQRQNQERLEGLIVAAQERCLTRIQAGQNPTAWDLRIIRREIRQPRGLSRTMALQWAMACLLAFFVEAALIFWLGSAEKSASPVLAGFVGISALHGFYLVLWGVFALILDGPKFRKTLEAHLPEVTVDPTLLPWIAQTQPDASGPSPSGGSSGPSPTAEATSTPQ
ncbi:hypothetical protein [Streptomyces sp. NPDC059491]|uniref:hypothetical protein n=1 Tax=Streptomyces sp. NPDC059491 TaxID=3346850 RepID=UPI0036C977D4